MILSFTRNFAFVHIHKCAGRSIEAALAPCLAGNDFLFELTPDLLPPDGKAAAKWSAIARTNLGLSMHSTAAAMQRFTGPGRWQRLFRFAFVRAPVDRLHSLYRYCLDRIAKAPMTDEEADRLSRLGLYPSRPPYNLRAVRATLESNSFSEFALHPETWRADGAKPQTRSLCAPDGTLLVEFIGRFEQLEQDWAKVQERLELEVPLPSINRTSSHASRALTDTAATYLRKRYEQDYLLLGYPRGS